MSTTKYMGRCQEKWLYTPVTALIEFVTYPCMNHPWLLHGEQVVLLLNEAKCCLNVKC